MENKNKIGLVAIAVIAVIIIPSILIGVQLFIQNAINSAEIEVDSIQISGMSEDQIIIDIEFDIITQVGIAISFRVKNVDILYNNTVLGNVSLSKDEFTTIDTSYQTTVTINITNSILYETLQDDFLNKNSLDFVVKGDVEFLEVLATVPPQSFTKEISILGLDGLNPEISYFDFTNKTDEIVESNIKAMFNNPTPIETNISMIQVNITYEEDYIGNATAEDVSFISGENEISLNALVNHSETTLIDDFLSNDDLNFTLNVSLTLELGGGLTINFQKNITIAAIGAIKPSIDSMNLVDATEKKLTLGINTSFNNPGAFQANISLVWIDIYYEDTRYIGNASINNLALTMGLNNVQINATLGGNDTALKEIIKNYIGKENSSINLNITVYYNNFTIEFDVELDLEGSGTDLITVSDIDIGIDLSFTTSGFPSTPSIDACGITFSVDITLHNPMSFDINLTYFMGEMYYNDTGDSIISFGNFTLASYSEDLSNRSLNNATLNENLEIPGNGQVIGNADVNPINSLEEGCRLYDEIFQDDDLEIDIIDGILKLQIGEFNITLTDVDLFDISVPSSACTEDLPI